MNFYVGQKVQCIDDGGYCYITRGKIYKINEIDFTEDLLFIPSDNATLTWYSAKIFKEYKSKQKEKEMIEKYEVVRPFNLKDIHKVFRQVNPYSEAFEDLLDEVSEMYNHYWEINFVFGTFIKEQIPKTLWSYRDNLVEAGLIKRVEEDFILKPGMKFKVHRSECTWTAVSGQNFDLYFSNGINLFYNQSSSSLLKVKQGITIDELNNISDFPFEVINEE